MAAADRPDQAFAGLVTAACGLAAAGDLDGALRMADRAVASDPRDPGAHAALPRGSRASARTFGPPRGGARRRP